MKRMTLLVVATLLAACGEGPTEPVADAPFLPDGPAMLVVPDGPGDVFSVGWFHACAIRMDRSLVCWGSNGGGQLNHPSGNDFVEVSGGRNHTCARRTDNTLVCWGGEDSDQGQADAPDGTFLQVSAGRDFTCGIRTDETLDCWGSDGFFLSSPPGGTFKAVSAGHRNACAIRTDGSLVCWGLDEYTILSPPGGNDFVEVITEIDERACARRTNGSLACWGALDAGYEPPYTPPGSDFADVGMSGDRGCALKTDGSLVCWLFYSLYPWQATPTGPFTALDAGALNFCARRTDGSLVCWGRIGSGLGVPNDPPSATADAYTTIQNTPLTVTAPGILANDSDIDDDPLTAQLVAGPANGALALNADGSFTYTPNTDFHGDDSFTYKANDGRVDSEVATVSIRVNPPLSVTIVISSDKKDAPNTINTKGNGLVSVTILGDPAEFALTDIDWTTLAFGPSGATAAHDLSDPATWSGHVMDVNRDGIPDLVTHYSQKATGLVSGDTEACLTGTIDGVAFEACGAVVVR